MVVVLACVFLFPLALIAWMHLCRFPDRTFNDMLPYLRRDHAAELEDLVDPVVEKSLRLNLSEKDFRKEQCKRIFLALECISQRAHNVALLHEWACIESKKSQNTLDEEVGTITGSLIEACREYRLGVWLIGAYLHLWYLKMVWLPFTAIPSISRLRKADSFDLLHSYTRITEWAEELAFACGGDCRQRLMRALDRDQGRPARVVHLDVMLPSDRTDEPCDGSESLATRTTCMAEELERFAPGFYFGDGAVHVNLREFMKEHGISDAHEIRAVLWSDIKSEFGDIPVQKLYDS